MTVDLELKKAFQEMQTKMVATTQQLKVSDMQINQLKGQIHHTHLVQKELTGLPETTKTYEGIGRMFMLQPQPCIKTNMAEKIKMKEEKIKSIETNKTYLERSLKESEANLRDLVLSKQKERT